MSPHFYPPAAADDDLPPKWFSNHPNANCWHSWLTLDRLLECPATGWLQPVIHLGRGYSINSNALTFQANRHNLIDNKSFSIKFTNLYCGIFHQDTSQNFLMILREFFKNIFWTSATFAQLGPFASRARVYLNFTLALRLGQQLYFLLFLTFLSLSMRSLLWRLLLGGFWNMLSMCPAVGLGDWSFCSFSYFCSLFFYTVFPY